MRVHKDIASPWIHEKDILPQYGTKLLRSVCLDHAQDLAVALPALCTVKNLLLAICFSQDA